MSKEKLIRILEAAPVVRAYRFHRLGLSIVWVDGTRDDYGCYESAFFAVRDNMNASGESFAKLLEEVN